jgi:hypothetical protein
VLHPAAIVGLCLIVFFLILMIAGANKRTPPRGRGHVPAGWKTDPQDERQWRYWTGTAWSDQRAPKD